MKLVRAKVTSKGQVTLPKSLRESLGIVEGDEIEFAMQTPSNAIIRKLDAVGSSAGVLKHLAGTEAVPLERMDDGVRDRMRKRFLRGQG